MRLPAALKPLRVAGAASGQDTNPGSSAMPFQTLQKAANVAVAGDTVVVRAGSYVGAKLSHSGTAAMPITFTAEPGAVVVSPGPSNSNLDNIWVRDASYVTTGVHAFSTPGSALTTAPIDLDSPGVGWLYSSTLLGNVRVRVTPASTTSA